jgi:mono/diheme cytochrome c family protein
MWNIIALTVLIAVVVLLITSGAYSWRAKSSFLKWTSVGIVALLTIPLSSIGALTMVGMVKQHARRALVPDLRVEATPERIARGKALADSFCGACHSKTGTLTGGGDMSEDLLIPIGSFVPTNLTPAGPLKHWSDGEIFRAIRNGIGADGSWLVLMSYTNAGRMSDDDTLAVIAYIRSVPAAGERTPDPPDQLNLLGLAMLGAGALPGDKPIITTSVTAPPKSPTRQFGEYILSYQDCRECHGARLTGGVPGQMGPLGPDLNVVRDWTLGQFIATMRTGIDPNGVELSKQMPWRPIGRMDDEELAAVYEYLTHLPGSQ